MLQTRVIKPADNAYIYPLLIKRLLMSGSRFEKTREIVYRDRMRYSYATFNERVARLANVLTEAGVKAGDTVAVMDWDSLQQDERYRAARRTVQSLVDD